MRGRAILLAFCLAAGADWLACKLLDQRAHAAFDRWSRVMVDQGWTVHTGAVTEDGMPFGARLTVRDLTVSGGQAMVPGGLDLHSDQIVLSLPLSSPFRLTVEAPGRQNCRLASLPPVVFEADSLTATVKLWRSPMDSIEIAADGLAGGLQHSRNPQDVRVGRLRMHLTAARGFSARTTAEVVVDARGLQLPDDGRWPLGATIGHLGFDLSLASPALSGKAASDQARAWRDWGGTLSLQRLDMHWGPLKLATTARLGLDQKLQPAGSGMAQVSGWAASLDALARGGAITSGVAQTAKAVLGLAVPPGTVQDDPALSLPFSLQDSTLSIGKLPLMRMSTLAWGGV